MPQLMTTAIGNLTDDPTLRFTDKGVAVARFTVAVSDRKYNKDTNTWEDGKTVFMRCTAFREVAEHVAESLAKGNRAIVTGHLEQSSWETPEGVKRTSIDLIVDEAAPSLKFATAKPTAASRSTGAPSGDAWSSPANDNVPF